MNLDFLDNKYFFAVFSILMLMYAAQIRQPLPQFMMDLFQNPIFRIAILFLILVRGYKDIQFSLIVSVAFILIMNIVNEQLFKESFEDTTTDIIAQQNTTDIIAQQNTPGIFAQQNTTDIIAQQNTTDIIAQQNTTDIIAQQNTTGMIAQQNTTDIIAQQNTTDIIAQQNTTDIIAQQNTDECYMIQQKMNDIKKCQEQNNLLDCSNETDINKEICEKNNDEITGLTATLGRKEYSTSLKLNEKCKGKNMINNNNTSVPLFCKNI